MNHNLIAALAACTAFWLMAGCTADVPEAPRTEATSGVVIAPPAQASPTPCSDPAARCAVYLGDSATETVEAPPAPVSLSDVPASGSAVRSSAVENPIPREIMRLPLVDGNTTLLDFRLDPDAAIAYLTDSESNLLIVDTAGGALLETLDVSGDRLLLDAQNDRLYIMPDSPMALEQGPEITVFDTAGRTVVDTLAGSRISVDTERNRLYVGGAAGVLDEDVTGIRLYDGATLGLLTEGEQAGEPLYNPDRDELIFVSYGAFTADPETLAVRDDLTPEINNVECRGCTGGTIVDEAFYFPDDGVVSLNVRTLATGGGPGIVATPWFYDAASMEPVAQPLEFASTCSSLPVLRTSIGGTILDHDLYVRYVVHNNLMLRDSAGNVLVFKDGLTDPHVNEDTGTGYVQDSFAATYVLDYATLSPIGLIDSYCFFAHDPEAGLLFASDAARQSLAVLEETGGESTVLPAMPHELAGHSVEQIVPSPAYATDSTVFIVTSTDDYDGQIVARSTDGGATWTRLGGLPVGNGLMLNIAISPTYAQDRTLFAGGYRYDAIGEGVWRSTDSGDTWLPHWVGLEALRVQRIAVSPRFAVDGAALAYSAYNRISPWEDGYVLSRSRDGGLTWTTVITAESVELLPGPSAYLPIPIVDEIPIRKDSWRTPLMVRVDPATWVTATLPISDDESIRATLAAPLTEPDRGARDLFVVTNNGVYRTADAGTTWTAWQDERLVGRTYENDIRSAEVTPLLTDGSYRLLIGTGDGALWSLDPAEATFGPLPEPEPDAGATITATVALTRTDTVTDVGTAATPEVTAGPQVTASPQATASPETTGTVPVAASPAPAAAQAPAPLPADAPDGLFVPEGAFASMWAGEPAMQQALGYAHTKMPIVTPAAYQYFDKGIMIWRGDAAQIYAVLTADNGWQAYADTFEEGDLEFDPAVRAPDDRYQPIRGFGKVWREHDDVRDTIGWATAEEEGLNGQVQEFERGLILRLGGLTYVLYETPGGNRLQP